MRAMKVHNPNNLPTIPIADLLPTQGNLKDLTEKNYSKLKGRIEHRGFSVPVYVWEDDKGVKHLLDGHQRRQVLTTEGWNDPIPYLKIPAKDLQEAMARLLEITSQYATITQEGIDEFMATYELNEAEVYEATSFDALGSYGSEEEAEIEEDEAPEVDESEPPKSKLGEVYQLGRHRVICADSTVKENVEKLMDGKKADMVFTDPPYGYKYESNYQTQHNMLMNDDQFLDFIPALYESLNDNCAVYTYGSFQTISFWIEYVKGLDLDFKNIIVWKKNNWSMGDLKGAYAGQHELIIYSVKGRVELRNGRDRDVWEFDREPPKLHPTMKPVELVVRAIRNTSDDGQIVLDPFLGSGSTLIACEQTDRTCYGMELSEAYIDVVRKRWAKYVYPERWEKEWEILTPAIATK